jgi:hypothetical protein
MSCAGAVAEAVERVLSVEVEVEVEVEVDEDGGADCCCDGHPSSALTAALTSHSPGKEAVTVAFTPASALAANAATTSAPPNAARMSLRVTIGQTL